jgi:hypothetical protein
MLYSERSRRHNARVKAVFPDPTGLATCEGRKAMPLSLPSDANREPTLFEITGGIVR